ncbi:MOSC domain-containing protein [Sediminihabitans luteus]|uniref:MOSC domain-containing protein n=1 Tax=Sediminihabitans luteus TaxID=1138585 RepID=A0A2M9D154_9CELL|nr:MOSC domain-containing protein [Sediminihabitans luteus]PJJ77890.1 MOSC domain-containing protein [Sediminihabitans luteus]GII99752.1 MOSC domain-containing protein [Sediminihabitans luteus]
MSPSPRVVAVAASAHHEFSKPTREQVTVVAGHGIEGDTHAGELVQHLSRKRTDPTQPNLRQVHLMHAELFDELRAAGYDVAPGELGENVTTAGLDLLALPRGARLRIGDDVVLRVTGLRNPCQQINTFRDRLLKQLLVPDADGGVVRKGGVMSVVEQGGVMRPGDAITVELPDGPHEALAPV